MALAATNDTESAAEAARITAREGRAIGVHVNFYPVLDVNNNPSNPIINTRAFSDNPETVANWGTAFIRAAQDAGQIATAKHFPGHGDTALDSHILLPTLNASRERLMQIELPPFRTAVQRGVRAIMTAHIAVPALEDSARDAARPATLSPALVDGILRRDFGFDGLVFTDALSMGAISNAYATGEAAVLAVMAGCDVALYPLDAAAAHAALLEAVAQGRISRERIDASVRRILHAKAWCGLQQEREVSLDNVWDVLASPDHMTTARELFENAVTLVRDPRGLLPLKKNKRTVAVILKDSVPLWAHVLREPAGSRFSKEVVTRFGARVIESGADAADIEQILADTRDCDVVLVGICARVAAYKGSVALAHVHAEVLRALDAAGLPIIAAVFGNPYVLPHMPESATTLLTFESAVESEEAAVRVIAGDMPARGRSPVSLEMMKA
jgi:beta-N-acetylhexosaminidase